MRRERKEIRKLLLGRTVLDDDGKLVTPAAGVIHLSQGVQNGAGAVRILGISRRQRRYDTDLGTEDILAEAEAGMMELGRIVRLREQPGTAACLIRHLLIRPVVLVFRAEEEGCTLTAWTGRGLLAWIIQRRAIRTFEHELGELLRPGAAAPKEKRGKRPEKPREEPAEDTAGDPEDTEA